MQRVLNRILMTLGAVLLAVLTVMLLSTFLPVQIARYVGIGTAFGVFTYVEEAYVKQTDRGVRQGVIAFLATVAILLVLDLFRR
ncbi:MAG: hypothetical protein ACOY94_00815 [Bacillota bacterium]